jgi:N-acetylneuraminic acid mutarotase
MCRRASRALITLVAAMPAIGLVGVALTLAGCGGNDNSNYVPPIIIPAITNYTIAGTVSGLTVSSVVLANGTATVSVAAAVGTGQNTWTFPTSFSPGSSYSITVQTQPTGEQCEVTSGGSGKDTGNVSNVTVACGFGQWTWEGGSKTVNATGAYGTQGTGSASNVPAGRQSATSWTDSAGKFWLFGGVGYDSTGGTGYLNDLWQYSPSTKEWTWVSGGNGDNASGIYGTQGTGAATNVPGARQSASSWIDSSGNLWLFGGHGYDSAGAVGDLNDLWRYSPSTNQWIWVSGGGAENASPVYGTQGTASAHSVPGARYSASSWIDSSGNLWLFGGYGYDSTGAVGNLNDLWRYSPSTNQWTWIGGYSGNNAVGVYGTQGTAAASNVPGARYSASSWIDSSGNLWLFGGYGDDSTGSVGKLNDLWEYSASSGQWTWVSGENDANVTGIYGTLGTASTSNLPGARQAAGSWIDSSGNLWLFGGVGYDSNGAVGSLSDLWEYSPSTSEWTWVSGEVVANDVGLYGTLGTGSVGNAVGGRNSISCWSDSSGNLWLFGGYGYDSAGDSGYLNDLWQYNPSTS